MAGLEQGVHGVDLPSTSLQAELCTSSGPALPSLPWETAWGGLEPHMLWHGTYPGVGSDGVWQHPAKKFLAGTQGSFSGENLLCVNMEDLKSTLLIPVPLPFEVSPVLEEVNTSLAMVPSFPETLRQSPSAWQGITCISQDWEQDWPPWLLPRHWVPANSQRETPRRT